MSWTRPGWSQIWMPTLLLATSRSFLLGSLYYETFPLNDLLCALAMPGSR